MRAETELLRSAAEYDQIRDASGDTYLRTSSGNGTHLSEHESDYAPWTIDVYISMLTRSGDVYALLWCL